MESTSRIVLTRSSEWMNRARSLQVYLDGQKIGAISNGGTEEFRIAPGQHKVTCKVDWCSSREFEVDAKPDETVYLNVRSGMKHYWIFVAPLLLGLILNLYFVFMQGGRPMWFNYLLIAICLPAFVYIFYFLTFGRKDYLVVAPDTRTLFGK